jgi:hypothetical protein
MTGCLIHRIQVQGTRVVHARSCQERISGAFLDRIDIGARPRAETGVEVLRDLPARMHRDRRPEHPVQGILDSIQIRHNNAGDRDDLT